jgi:hypothetical protein
VRTLHEIVEGIRKKRDTAYSVGCLVKRLQRFDPAPERPGRPLAPAARNQGAGAVGVEDECHAHRCRDGLSPHHKNAVRLQRAGACGGHPHPSDGHRSLHDGGLSPEDIVREFPSLWVSSDERAQKWPRKYLEEQRPFVGMIVWTQQSRYDMQPGEFMRRLEALEREAEPIAYGFRHIKPE